MYQPTSYYSRPGEKLTLNRDITAIELAVDSTDGEGYAATDVIGPKGSTVTIVWAEDGYQNIEVTDFANDPFVTGFLDRESVF